jgi:four helix bundle protein
MDLAVEIYRVTRKLPESERFGLTAQLRGAAVSVPSNTAEGAGRAHTGDYRRHLSIALGSLAECETQLTLATRVQLLSEPDIEPAWALAQDAGRLIRRLDQSLSRRSGG